MDILVSFIVPVYNVEQYLSECIDSIIDQEYKIFELILVDDGSTDNSGLMCDEYCQKDKRIRIYHTENVGQAKARNYGFAQSKGEYICFVDSDDVLHPGFLSSLIAGITECDAQISMCSAKIGEYIPNGFYQINSCSFVRKEVDEVFFYSLIESEWETQGIKLDVIWGKLIHRDLINSFPFAEGRIYEDTAIVCWWFDAAKVVSDSSNQLYFYRKRKNSTITADFSAKRLDQLWADEEIETFYRKREYKKMIAFATLSFCQHAISIERELEKSSDNGLLKSIRKKKRKKILKNIHRWNLSKNDYLYYFGELVPGLNTCLRILVKVKKKIIRM